MKQVQILQGLPASGKSTYARELQEKYAAGAVVRINNDDIAETMFGDPWSTIGTMPGRGKILSAVRSSMLEAALGDSKVELVIVDNTNLTPAPVIEAANIALKFGAAPELIKDFLDVPVEECVRRNRERDRKVPDEVIYSMAKNLHDARRFQLPRLQKITPYVEPAGPFIPNTIIVDIDGTVAKMNGRGPYDWGRVQEDSPNGPVVEMVIRISQTLHTKDPLIFLSGRDEVCREETYSWLYRIFGVTGRQILLFMRPEGDKRRDAVVKHELFHKHIQGNFRVIGVFDDRDQVVDLWRRMGLQTYQVAEGKF